MDPMDMVAGRAKGPKNEERGSSGGNTMFLVQSYLKF